MTSTQKSPAEIAQILEGVDFIETEEDAKAVEAATLKIQSTFRGKKFRSKLGAGGGEAADRAEKKPVTEPKEVEAKSQSGQKEEKKKKEEAAARDLSKKVSEMQVNDKKELASQQQVGGGEGGSGASVS